MSNSLSIIINDLTLAQHDQIADLLLLAGLNPVVFDQPAQQTFSIEIGLNKANANALEGILQYITKHIYNGEQHEH